MLVKQTKILFTSFCCCSHYQLHYHPLKYWIWDNTKYWNLEHDSLVGSANSRGRIGTLIKPKLAWVFVCFHSLLLAFLLARFLAFLAFSRISWQDSWRFLDFLGFLDKILGFSWKVFCTKNTFSAFFQSKKLSIFLEVLGKILQDRTYSWRSW